MSWLVLCRSLAFVSRGHAEQESCAGALLQDEAIDILLSSLVDVGCEIVDGAMRVKDLPTQAVYQAFEEAGGLCAHLLRGADGCV